MPYEKQNLPIFEGLNKGVEPDAIKDTQASDMLNLRFTKLGYLVNRNGVRAFDFAHDIIPQAPDITQISGATAIGEFILSAPVTDKVDFDPLGDAVIASVINASHSFPLQSYDRFMVFGLRCKNISEPDKARMVYVLVPNNQLPESVQTFTIDNDYTSQPQNAGDCVFFLRPELAGDTESTTAAKPQLFQAPARWMGRGRWVDSVSGVVRDQGWIEHYQRMAQYGNALVIADRQNGDLIIHDKWDETPVGRTKSHELRMQENCNAFFDVDDVLVDFRLASGEENGGGVENGMALYRFYLQHKGAIVTLDNYTESMYDTQVSKNQLAGSGPSYAWATKMMDFSSAFLSGFNISDNGATDSDLNRGGVLKGMFKNTIGRSYTFSDYNQPTQIDSLLDKVTQSNPALSRTYDDDGVEINNNAADVYIWNDLKLKYYPCTGTDQSSQFLTPADRKWNKKIPTVPRIVELTTKAGVKQRIPLGVWAYRFVWVFENGEYSSPSSPLLVPDKLWSCLKDSATLSRPVLFDTINAEHTHDRVHVTWYGLNTTSGSLPGQSVLFSADMNVTSGTDYERIMTRVKEELYEQDHAYGALAANVNKQVLATVTSNGPIKKLSGVFLSGYQFGITVDTAGSNTYKMLLDHHHKASLIVPITRSISDAKTNGSIFTEAITADSGVIGGLYRRAMVDKTYLWQDTIHEFVFEGANNTFARDTTESDRSTFDLDAIRYKKDVYYNLMIHRQDQGVMTGASPDYYRVPTTLRYVTNQSYRLSYTKTTANPEAVSRLLAEGIAEFQLMDYSDWAVCRSEFFGSYEYDNQPFIDTMLPSKIDTAFASRRYTPNVADTILQGIMLVPDYSYIDSSNAPLGEQYAYWNGDASNRYMYTFGHYERILSAKETPQPWVAGTGAYVGTGAPRKWYELNNVRVAIHLEGERLLLPEQVSSFFSSSLLFNSPRVQLNVAKERIPKRAKSVMIFRTLASHDNDWQPSKFGLVEEVALNSDVQGKKTDFSYFDKTRDNDLDFATTPEEFDGVVTPLRSLFVKSLKEKMWYGNLEERYQTYAPRGFVDNIENASGTGHVSDLTPNLTLPLSKVATWKEFVVDSNSANASAGFTSTLNGKYHEYFVIFKDINGDYSAPKMLRDNATPYQVDFTSVPSNKLTAVALVLAGYPYNAAIDQCEVYRRSYVLNGSTKSDKFFYKIGDIKAEDEGIFVDNGIPADPVQKWTQYDERDPALQSYLDPISAPREDRLESSIAWSESGQPSWIKYENRFAFRDGDGDQITGMEVIYSELLVFKERSMHRVTLENISNNIGRVEEVSNTIGCIAPNTIICYDNTIYFLSWHGFMKYDNNGLSKVDGSFAIELQQRLSEHDSAIHNPAIRDSSVALNSTYRELYLNIPAYAGSPAFDYHNDGVKGHIYAINLDNQQATKFQYETGDAQIFTPLRDPNAPTTSGTDYRTMARIYHTNSYGQLWSAETLPKTPYVSSKVYLEAPTTRDYDEYQPGITASGAPETVSKIAQEPVHSWWRSKEFTGDDKSLLKRLRMVIANIARGTNPVVGTEFNNDDYSAAAYRENMFGVTGELKVVPSRRLEGFDRGERMAIHIASEGDTEIQGLGFHWRKVNTWTR